MAISRFETARAVVIDTATSTAMTVKDTTVFLLDKLRTFFVKLCGSIFGYAAVSVAGFYAGWYLFTTTIQAALAIGIATKVLNTLVLPKDKQIDVIEATQYTAAGMVGYGMQAFNYIQPVMFSAGEYVGESAATLVVNAGESAGRLAIKGTQNATLALQDKVNNTVAATPSYSAAMSKYLCDTAASMRARFKRLTA